MLRLKSSLLPYLLALGLTLATTVKAADEPGMDDGPYVKVIDQQGWQARWLCQGKLIEQNLSAQQNQLASVCAYPFTITLRPALNLANSLKTAPRYRAEKIAALSDIHGQFDLMLELLQANKVIDQAGNWSFGKGHLVLAGDVFDRGPKVTEALWLLYNLEAQAQQAGGAVHMLLGNHEVMTLANDLRYLNKKYQDNAAQLASSYPALYDQNTVLGNWLRSKPVMTIINDHLFLHAGVDADLLKYGKDIASINQQMQRGLAWSKPEIKSDVTLAYLFGSQGPIWFRGYFKNEAQTPEVLQQVLSHYQLQRIVVGHTTFDAIYQHYQGKVISIDSDIKSGKRAQVLFLENAQVRRADRLGQQSEIPHWQAQTSPVTN